MAKAFLDALGDPHSCRRGRVRPRLRPWGGSYTVRGQGGHYESTVERERADTRESIGLQERAARRESTELFERAVYQESTDGAERSARAAPSGAAWVQYIAAQAKRGRSARLQAPDYLTCSG